MRKLAAPARIQKAGMGQATGYHSVGVPFLLHNINAAELGAGTVRHLVKDGRWNVPPDQRPKGWERLLVREP